MRPRTGRCSQACWVVLARRSAGRAGRAAPSRASRSSSSVLSRDLLRRCFTARPTAASLSRNRVSTGSLWCGAMERLAGQVLGRRPRARRARGPAGRRRPSPRAALALAHAGLGGLLGDRLVGEDADVELAAALHVAGDGDARGLDLARGDPAAGRWPAARSRRSDACRRPWHGPPCGPCAACGT